MRIIYFIFLVLIASACTDEDKHKNQEPVGPVKFTKKHKDNSIHVIGYFNNGKLDSTMTYYFPEGKIERIIDYEMDSIRSVVEFGRSDSSSIDSLIADHIEICNDSIIYTGNIKIFFTSGFGVIQCDTLTRYLLHDRVVIRGGCKVLSDSTEISGDKLIVESWEKWSSYEIYGLKGMFHFEK